MKIPFGYGKCKLKFYYDDVWHSVYMKVDQSSFREIVEIKDEFVNIFNDIKKKVIGYHYKFDLILMDYNYPNSQDNIMNALYYYQQLPWDDKHLQIFPIYGAEEPGWPGSSENITYFTVLADKFEIVNFIEKRALGQKLHIVCYTRDMIDDLQFLYKETSDDSWGIYDSGMARGGSSRDSGLGDKKYANPKYYNMGYTNIAQHAGRDVGIT